VRESGDRACDRVIGSSLHLMPGVHIYITDLLSVYRVLRSDGSGWIRLRPLRFPDGSLPPVNDIEYPDDLPLFFDTKHNAVRLKDELP
jgi:hypothetical protein